MNLDEYQATLKSSQPPANLSVSLAALWWDAKGDWQRAHLLVNELETEDAMAVHAYLHRKEGDISNANYWYARAGRDLHRPQLEDEWNALVAALLKRA